MSKMFEGFKEVIKKYYKLVIFFIVFSEEFDTITKTNST